MAQEREAMQRKVEKLQSLVMNLINSGNNKEGNTGSLSKDTSSSIGDISGLLSPDAMDTTQEDSSETTMEIDSESERVTHNMGNKPDILPDNARMPVAHHSNHSSRSDLSQGSKTSSTASRRISPGKTEKIELPAAPQTSDKQTANEIIALLEQMQGPSTVVDPNHIPHGFCMRYMGSYNVI